MLRPFTYFLLFCSETDADLDASDGSPATPLKTKLDHMILHLFSSFFLDYFISVSF